MHRSDSRSSGGGLRTRRPVAAAIIVAALLGACGGGGSTDEAGKGSADSSAEGSSTEVEMRLIAFKPESLKVPVGTTVKWKMTDAGFHTVTSGVITQESSGVSAQPDGKFDSGRIAQDGSFEYKFDAAGTFKYYCDIHRATMSGEVQVG